MVANLPCLTTYEHEMFYLLRAGIVLRQKAGPGGSMDVWRFWQLGRYRAGAPINSSMVTALPSITHGLPEIYVEVCWVICDAANLIAPRAIRADIASGTRSSVPDHARTILAVPCSVQCPLPTHSDGPSLWLYREARVDLSELDSRRRARVHRKCA